MAGTFTHPEGPGSVQKDAKLSIEFLGFLVVSRLRRFGDLGDQGGNHPK